MEKSNTFHSELNGNISIPFKFIEKDQEIGIGTDIESIDRFRRSDFKKGNRFLNKIFTEKELDYCFSKFDAAPCLTARFSAKEAIFKALNNLGKIILDFKEIEILNNEKGMPIVKINNEILKDWEVKLSLSHCDNTAIAFALARKMNNEKEI